MIRLKRIIAISFVIFLLCLVFTNIATSISASFSIVPAKKFQLVNVDKQHSPLSSDFVWELVGNDSSEENTQHSPEFIAPVDFFNLPVSNAGKAACSLSNKNLFAKIKQSTSEPCFLMNFRI